jgi:hypothetical protein
MDILVGVDANQVRASRRQVCGQGQIVWKWGASASDVEPSATAVDEAFHERFVNVFRWVIARIKPGGDIRTWF